MNFYNLKYLIIFGIFLNAIVPTLCTAACLNKVIIYPEKLCTEAIKDIKNCFLNSKIESVYPQCCNFNPRQSQGVTNYLYTCTNPVDGTSIECKVDDWYPVNNQACQINQQSSDGSDY